MVVRKDIDNCSCLLTVTITRDELKSKLDAELKRLRQRMPIKGFRPGQVPMDYLKKMYGQAVFTDTLNDLFSDRLVEYLREARLDTLGQPLPAEEQPHKFSININNPDPEYKIDYEVGFVPKFDVQGISKSDVYEVLTVSDLDALAEEDLQHARKRMGKRTNPTDDIQENDILRISAKELTAPDGDVKDGGWETSMTFFMKNVADEALKNTLLAGKLGDTVRFNARLVENNEKEEMYRKYILNLPEDDDRQVSDWFEGVIEEVSRVADADLDDEFFQGYFGTNVSSKEEALDKLKEGISQFYEIRSNALLFRSLQERLMELNRIELPEKFLRRWLEVSNRDTLSPEQIEQELPFFLENLRWTIIRDDLVKEFGIEVTESDLRAAYARRMRSYFQVDLPDHIIDSSIDRLMKDKKDLENTREELQTDKLLAAVRGEVTLAEKAVTSEEFHKIIEEITAQQKSKREGTPMNTVLEEENA
jgi:trigger factor